MKTKQIMMTECAETIYGPFMITETRCSRSAGYGLNQAYCKQHARFHPADGEPLKMTTTLYKPDRAFGKGADKIVAVPASEVTEHTFINVRGRRESLMTNYGKHYATWIEANTALIKKAELDLSCAKVAQANAEKELEELRARVDPTKHAGKRLRRGVA